MATPLSGTHEPLAEQLQRRIDSKTKPPGSLGRIEELAAQIGMLQESCVPKMTACRLTIFAGDHGIATAGVSAYPQEVTGQMVLNFLQGGAAANVFAASLGVDVQVVDAGVAGDAIAHPELLDRRVDAGTANSIVVSAMTDEQFENAIAKGRQLGVADDVDAVCFGEMGIGNTSSAALVCHKTLGLELPGLIGRGTGVDDAGLQLKSRLLAQAAARTASVLSGDEAMREYGGFEMAMMTGAMLAASAARKLVIVDGFIASAAAAVAIDIDSASRSAMVFAHQSAEHGHRAVLDALGVRPLLNLEMRLGEGTGALLAWPLVKCAASMLRDMASFEGAGVSGRA